jgi:hypothetical protein
MARDVAAASGLQQIDVPVVTLDEICRKEGRWPDIVKVDAEGIDLDVLQGATTLFGKTDVFLVECGVCAFSLPNSVAEVCSFMANHSYRLFDITHLNVSPRTGLLWLVEAVFVRETSAVWDRLGGY